MTPQWTTPTFEIVWTRVGPPLGTFPNTHDKHLWHALSERCEHDVIIGNWCSGCTPMHRNVPVIDWNPRSLTEPTVDHISGKLVTKVKCWKRDPTWHGYKSTPWILTGQVWPFTASSDGKWDKKTEGAADKLNTLDNEPHTFPQALDAALNAEHTTTSLDQEVFDGEGHTVNVLDIVEAGSFTQQEPASDFFNGWRLHDPNVVAMPFVPTNPNVIIGQYVLRAEAKFDADAKAKRINPSENRNVCIAATVRQWMKGRRSQIPVVQKAIERMQCASESTIRKYRKIA